jgi:thiol-disulfide isomerase/thioredoxin
MLRALICSLAVLALVPAGWVRAAGGKDEKGLNVTGKLTTDDPFDKVRAKSYAKTYKFKMVEGKTYQIDMKSKAVDSYLRLEDSTGKQLAFDDDGGGFPDARIVFKAPKDDTYVIICTTFGGGETGEFTLTVMPASEKLGAFNQLKNDFQALGNDLGQKYNATKDEAEKDKIFDQFFEGALDYAIKFNAFAEANASDPISKDATKMCSELLSMASSQAKTASAGAKFRELMTKAKSKDVQAAASVALGSNLIMQYEKAYQKKDKAGAAKLATEAETTLKEAKMKYSDVQGPRETIGKMAESMLDTLQHRSVGKVAAEITGELIDGKKFKLSDFKGKVVVLYFWGSWCPPCKAMIPDEKKLVARLAKAPFAMVGINTDNDKDMAKKFLAEQGITWTQVWDNGSTQGPINKAWHIDHWPTIYVLDANGVIRYREVRGVAMDNAVDELLKELPGGGT